MNRLNRLVGVCRLNSRLALTVVQPQPRFNHSALPRSKLPGEGKGPISWKSMKYIIGLGGVLFGVLKYMELKRDAGKFGMSAEFSMHLKTKTFFEDFFFLGFSTLTSTRSGKGEAQVDWEGRHWWPMAADKHQGRSQEIVRLSR